MKESEPTSSFNNLDEFKKAIEADGELDAALKDMETSDSSVNRAFLSQATSQQLAEAYEIVKKHASNIKTYKSKYPQNSDSKAWDIYKEAERKMYTRRQILMNEFTDITG